MHLFQIPTQNCGRAKHLKKKKKPFKIRCPKTFNIVFLQYTAFDILSLINNIWLIGCLYQEPQL